MLFCIAHNTVDLFGLNVNAEHLKACAACFAFIVIGGVGGITGAWLRRLFGYAPALNGWKSAPGYFGAGAAAAFALVVLFRGVGLIPEGLCVMSRDVYFFALAFVSGVFSMRLIRGIGNFLEKRINELSEELDASKKREDQIEKGMDRARRYSEVLMKAQTALMTKAKMDVEDGIRYVREAIKERPADRTLNIFCGRLLRIQGEYGLAIDVLTQFIAEVKKAEGMKVEDRNKALAAANYNCACYHCLAARGESGVARTTSVAKARACLRSAIERDARYEEEIAKDPDFDGFRDDIR